MDDELLLPELQDALLDAPTVEQLFLDIRHASELLGVSLKGGAEARASELASSDPLAHAQEALRQGSVLGVQLRYRHRGREWWDTLLRVSGGVRLVRIAPDFHR
jgi:hypothetical protein